MKMIYIGLTDRNIKPLAFYLALEEWVAGRLPAAEYVFDWVVGPTVIIGRNQDLRSEVNTEYCRNHGIDVVRRRSGGGCVFADEQNIMISYIAPSVEVQSTFSRFTGAVAEQLRKMGIAAEVGGRNDILVGERKISGSAFYHLASRSIVHGTMLYSTDIEHMLNAITPGRAKLESKKVQSVQTRIVTARELLPELTMEKFREGLLRGLTDGQYILTPEEEAEVRLLEQRYYAPGWLDDASAERGGATVTEYLPGVGTVSVTLSLTEEGRIHNSRLSGDFFSDRELNRKLLNGHTVEEAAALNPISGMSAEAFGTLVHRAARKYIENKETVS